MRSPGINLHQPVLELREDDYEVATPDVDTYGFGCLCMRISQWHILLR
jgi:hypothetical protein